jgi:hypothetical protein
MLYKSNCFLFGVISNVVKLQFLSYIILKVDVFKKNNYPILLGIDVPSQITSKEANVREKICRVQHMTKDML